LTADITRIDEWMIANLRSDFVIRQGVDTRIYTDQAPQQSGYPLLLCAFLGGADKMISLRSQTRLTTAIYLVRVITRGSSFDVIEDIADHIEQALFIPPEGYWQRDVLIQSCRREQPHQRKDMENGVPFVYLGGFYRIQYQPFTLSAALQV
jgi:hypothetical protein